MIIASLQIAAERQCMNITDKGKSVKVRSHCPNLVPVPLERNFSSEKKISRQKKDHAKTGNYLRSPQLSIEFM